MKLPHSILKRYAEGELCVIGSLMVVLGFVIIALGVRSFLIMFLGLALCAGGARVIWVGASYGVADGDIDSRRESRRSNDIFVKGLQATIYVSVFVAVISAIWLFAIDSNNAKLNSIFMYSLIISIAVYILSMIFLVVKATFVVLTQRARK